ncbi:hypothetical protein E2320_022418, partial [Naja naja]
LEGLRVNSGGAVSAEPPGVTVVRGKTEVEDGMETHARLDGFYPREIDASWTRDGEVWEEETFHGSLAPNVDGTYHYWLSIRIDPKERGAIGATWSTAACRSLWTWPWKVRGCREGKAGLFGRLGGGGRGIRPQMCPVKKFTFLALLCSPKGEKEVLSPCWIVQSHSFRLERKPPLKQ